jgi:hypothetical protein
MCLELMKILGVFIAEEIRNLQSITFYCRFEIKFDYISATNFFQKQIERACFEKGLTQNMPLFNRMRLTCLEQRLFIFEILVN